MLKKSRNLLLIIGAVIFIIAGFIFIENSVYPAVYESIYPGTKINVKSDAEIIAYFQTHKEKFNQLIPEELQSRKDYEVLRLEVNKKNEVLRDQLKKNEEINKHNEQLKNQERFRLQEEISRNTAPLHQLFVQKRRETNKFLEGIGFSVFSLNMPLTKWECGRAHNYEEEHFSHSDFRTTYSVQKGIVWFDENNQPDKQYVVDSFDKFHSVGNIIIDAQRFVSKFGEDAKPRYLHLEGNWYLFLTIRISKKYPDPVDGYNY